MSDDKAKAIYLLPDTHKALKLLALKRNKTLIDLTNEIITNYLKTQPELQSYSL